MDELEDSTLVLSFKWTNDYTSTLIRLRQEKREYFTGKRNTAKAGWEYVLKEMGLEGIVSVKQAKKKWDNLIHKFKELKSARIGTTEGELAATTWPFYDQMEEATSSGPLVTLPIVISSITDGQPIECDEDGVLPHVHFLEPHCSSVGATSASAPDTPNVEEMGRRERVRAETKKRRRDSSDDAYLGLFQQSRQDWIRMHNTFERQGERMIALLGELVKSVKKTN